MPLPDPAFFIVALMMAGTGSIFFWYDRERPASRALSLCMIAIGLRLLLSGSETGRVVAQNSTPVQWLIIALEGLSILAGIEWGRRVALTGTYRPNVWTLRLFRIGQLLVLFYCLLRWAFDLIYPDLARAEESGLSRATGIQWLVLGPTLVLAIVLTGVAIARLRVVRIDEAEQVRLQALSLAGPFLLAALFISEPLVPMTLTVGLLIFLWGSVRYLILQARRGQFMRQFLSPQVAQLVQTEGMQRTLQRERRVLTVVVCDLRGFTRYAREHPSDEVTGLLERFYAVVGQVAGSHGGTVKDHAGDGVLILVGAPLAQPDHASRGVQLALAMRSAARDLLQVVAPELGVGIGLATGKATVGAIQGAGRLEYVAVGNPVNLAARLCDRAADGEVLSDRRTAEVLTPADGVHVEDRAPEPLKGFPEPIPVCALGGEPAASWQQDGRRSRKRRGRRRGRPEQRAR